MRREIGLNFFFRCIAICDLIWQGVQGIPSDLLLLEYFCPFLIDPLPLNGEGSKKTGSPEVPSAIVSDSDNYKGDTPTQGYNQF